MRYFFGKNVDGVKEFSYFSFAHILPLILLGVVIWLLYRYREKIRNYKNEEKIRFGLAIVMIICEMSYFWRLLSQDMFPNAWDHLPITICGWACILGSFMLFTKSKLLYSIVYFMVLALSFNALITPVPLQFSGPTRFRYYQYWIEHIAIYAAVFYMTFVHKYRPTFKSMIPAGATIGILATVAVVTNYVLGSSPLGALPNNEITMANYLYIARTEDSFSLANFLPKNEFLKYFLLVLVVGIFFFLAYLPWFIMDIKKHKALKQNGAQVLKEDSSVIKDNDNPFVMIDEAVPAAPDSLSR